MMKKFTILFALILSFGLVKAQPFEVGTNVLGIGVGLGGHYSYWGSGYSATPALGISYDHGFKDGLGPGVIGIGGYFGYKGMSYHYDYLYSNYFYDEKWTYLIFGLRGTYHYNFDLDDNLDLYGGLMFSYNNLNYKYSSNDPTDPDYNRGNYHGYVDLSLFVGGSYYFTDKIGGFMELGYGIAYCTIGLNFKL